MSKDVSLCRTEINKLNEPLDFVQVAGEPGAGFIVAALGRNTQNKQSYP